MIKKENFKPLSIVGIGNVMNAFLGFIFFGVVGNTLNAYDFGIYTFVTGFIVAASKLTDFGSNSQFVADSIAQEKVDSDTFLSSKIILLIATIPFSILFLYMFNLMQPTIVALTLVGITLYTFNHIAFTYMQLEQSFTFAIGLNTIPAIIKVLGAVLIKTNLVTNDITTSLSIFVLSLSIGLFLIFTLKNKITFKQLNIYSGLKLLNKSFFAGTALVTNHSWPTITNAIAEQLVNFAAVSVYSIATKISNIFSLISLSLFTVLLPKNAHTKKTKGMHDIKELFAMSAIIIILSLIAIAMSEFIINLIFTNKYKEVHEILWILILAGGLTAVHSFIENYFYIEEKTQFIAIVTITKIIAFTIGIFFFSYLGIKGIAYAQLLSAVLGIITTLVFIKKLLIF